MASRSDITPELCRQLLRYEPETGRLYWRERPRGLCPSDRIFKSWNTKWAGKPAFEYLRHSGKSGYTTLSGAILNVPFKAHRVAWAIHFGEWPDGEIDHVNGDPLDNRIANLRIVTRSENMRNMRLPSDNKSGCIGVHWSERHSRWVAKLRMPGVSRYKHLGLFKTVEAAAQAIEDAKSRYDYHPNHGRSA